MPTEIPERWRPLDERTGMVAVTARTMLEVSLAIRRSLPTMKDAVQFIDEIDRRLGERAWRDPEGGADRRRLFLRDPSVAAWLVPLAFVEQAYAPAAEEIDAPAPVTPKEKARPCESRWPIPVDAPEGWTWDDPDFRPRDPKPQILPSGPTMGSGTLTLAEGPASYALHYGRDGWRCGSVESTRDELTFLRYFAVRPYMVDSSARPPLERPVSLLSHPGLDAKGHDVAAFARMACETKIAERVAARVYMPALLPGGPEGCWRRVEPMLREILWTLDAPHDARWLVVDGYEATARALGRTLSEALDGWRREVQREPPFAPGENPVVPLPTKPTPIALEDIPEAGEYEDPDGKYKLFSTGLIQVTIPPQPPARDVPRLEWPKHVDGIPAVAVPLPPTLEVPEKFRTAAFRVRRLVGTFGHVRHAFVRGDASGFTLVGEGIADLVDPASLDDELDAADDEERAWIASLPPEIQRTRNMWQQPRRVIAYNCWDAAHQRRMPMKISGGEFGGGSWTPRSLVGDAAAWQVIRAAWR